VQSIEKATGGEKFKGSKRKRHGASHGAKGGFVICKNGGGGARAKRGQTAKIKKGSLMTQGGMGSSLTGNPVICWRELKTLGGWARRLREKDKGVVRRTPGKVDEVLCKYMVRTGGNAGVARLKGKIIRA